MPSAQQEKLLLFYKCLGFYGEKMERIFVSIDIQNALRV
jgi:hypothetical protein